MEGLMTTVDNRQDSEDEDIGTTPVLPKLVGQRVKRREDPRLVRGRGTYVDDVKIHGLRHLAFKRSDVAHGGIRSVDTRAAAAMDGVEAVFTGAEIAEFLDPMPIGTPFPSPEHRAVAVDTVRFVGDPVAVVVARDRYAARDAADAVVVDVEPLPAVVDPEEAMTGRPAVLHADYPTNVALGPLSRGDGHTASRAGGRHRRRRGVRGRRRGRLAADGEPAARPQRDRGARGGGPLRGGQGRDDDLVVDPEPAHTPDVRGADGGPRPGPGAGHRPRGRRRVRGQDQHLRRGVRGGGAVEAPRHAPEVGRGPVRGVPRHRARPRPHRLRRPRGPARRHGPRPEAAPRRRHRRLQHAADGGHPHQQHDHGQRHLRVPRRPRHPHRGVHQQDADRRVSRRRPARGHLLRRAGDGHARARARHRPGGAAPEELHPPRPVPLPDPGGRGLRLGRLREDPRPRTGDGGLGTAKGRARRRAGRRAGRGTRAVDVRRDLWHGAVRLGVARGGGSTRRSRSSATAASAPPPGRRPTARATRRPSRRCSPTSSGCRWTT